MATFNESFEDLSLWTRESGSDRPYTVGALGARTGTNGLIIDPSNVFNQEKALILTGGFTSSGDSSITIWLKKPFGEFGTLKTYIDDVLVSTISYTSILTSFKQFTLASNIPAGNHTLKFTCVYDSDGDTFYADDLQITNVLESTGTTQFIVPQLNTNNLSIGYDPLNGGIIV